MPPHIRSLGFSTKHSRYYSTNANVSSIIYICIISTGTDLWREQREQFPLPRRKVGNEKLQKWAMIQKTMGRSFVVITFCVLKPQPLPPPTLWDKIHMDGSLLSLKSEKLYRDRTVISRFSQLDGKLKRETISWNRQSGTQAERKQFKQLDIIGQTGNHFFHYNVFPSIFVVQRWIEQITPGSQLKMSLKIREEETTESKKEREQKHRIKKNLFFGRFLVRFSRGCKVFELGTDLKRDLK